MPVTFYMDEHVPLVITEGLRLRGVDVLTAQEDGAVGHSDAELLARATELERVVFSQDDDLLREGTQCLNAGVSFGGIVYIHQLRTLIGPTIDDLELIGTADDAANWKNRIEYLPLR